MRFLLGILCAVIGFSQNPQGVPENAVMRVSDHVYAIIGFPNIAYVVGTRAILVVDTAETSGAVVGKAQQVEVRERVGRAKVFALVIEDVDDARVGGSDGELGSRESWKGWANATYNPAFALDDIALSHDRDPRARAQVGGERR